MSHKSFMIFMFSSTILNAINLLHHFSLCCYYCHKQTGNLHGHTPPPKYFAANGEYPNILQKCRLQSTKNISVTWAGDIISFEQLNGECLMYTGT